MSKTVVLLVGSSLRFVPLEVAGQAEGFGAATVAVQVGKEIWIGTNRGDRIGRFPAQ